MSLLERAPQTAPDFISDDEMAKLSQAQPAPEFISDDDMAKLDADAAHGRDTFSQLASGLGHGVKEALLPFAVTAEETNKERTGLEMAAGAVGNVGAGVAASSALGAAFTAALGAIGSSAATGAAAGSAVGPAGTIAGLGIGAFAGLVTYGLYAGIGNEYMRSQAEGQDFNPLRAAGHVALEVNPLLRSSRGINRALQVAAQIGGSGALEYSYSKSPVAAGLSAALGGIVPTIMTRGFRADRMLTTPDAVTNAMEALGESGLAAKVARRVSSLSEGELTPEVNNPTFRRWVVEAAADESNKSVNNRFNELWGRLGDEVQAEHWKLYKTREALVDEADKMANTMSSSLGGSPAEPTSTLGRWLKDFRLVANDVDEKLGTNLTGVGDLASRSKDAFAQAAQPIFDLGMRARKATNKLGVSDDVVGKALAGRWELIPEAVQAKLRSEAGEAAIGQWRQAFDGVFKQLKASGYEPGYLENYLPLNALRGADLSLAVEGAVGRLKAEAARTGKDIRQLLGESKEAQELAQFLSGKFGKSVDELTNADYLAAPRRLLGEELKDKAGYSASALIERTGDLPDWAREWHPGKLLAGYVNNNLKALYMRDAFRLANANIDALKTMGLDKTAQFFEDWTKRISGHELGLNKMMSQAAEEMRLWGRRTALDGGLGGAAGRAVAALPDFAAWMRNLTYPAFLGGNVRAVARNATQLWATTAPEIGGAYGYGLVNKALWDAAKDITAAGAKGRNLILDTLKAKGQLSDVVRGAALVDEAGLPSKFTHSMNHVNDLLMSMYSGTDNVNRFLSLQIGNQWAHDIVSGNQRAISALQRVQRGTKQEILPLIQDAMRTKDASKLGDILGDYLIGKTQFRYGKEQLSQFGAFMGPAFSMFTKWPVMVTSDIVNVLRHKSTREAIGNLTERYFGPYMALAALGGIISNVSDVDKTPTWKYLMGNSLTELSPLQAAFNWNLSGGPALRAIPALGTVLKDSASSDKPFGDIVSQAARGVAKTSLPVISPVLNEIDRAYEAAGKDSYSTQLIRRIRKGEAPHAPNPKYLFPPLGAAATKKFKE